MTTADVERLAQALGALGETFNEPVSKVRANAYLFALEDFTIGQVEDAIRQAIKHCKFFPRPAELRELLEGNPGDQAMLAWSELISEVRRVGSWRDPDLSPATAEAVRSLWGSWSHLCATLPGEGPELIGWMKQFQQTFSAHREQGHRPELMGRDEAKQLLDGLTGKNRGAEQLPSAYRGPVSLVRQGPEDGGDDHG